MGNVEPRALEYGIQLKESGIPLVTGIRNPISIDKDPEFSTCNPESTVWNPESKTVLDYLTWGEKDSQIQETEM